MKGIEKLAHELNTINEVRRKIEDFEANLASRLIELKENGKDIKPQLAHLGSEALNRETLTTILNNETLKKAMLEELEELTLFG